MGGGVVWSGVVFVCLDEDYILECTGFRWF